MPFQTNSIAPPRDVAALKFGQVSDYRLFILDTSCLFHLINYRLNQNALSGDESLLYAQASFHWINDLGFIPAFRGRANSVIIWAEDNKPYWRNEIFPAYKQNRNTPDPVVSALRDLFDSLEGFCKLGFPGYEADDVACLYSHLWANRSPDSAYKEVYYCTSDSDWQGFISRADQYWLNFTRHGTRVRQRQEIYQWLQKKHSKQSRKRQREWPLPEFEDFRCGDIWRWKSVVGDSSDGLPAGADLGLINLFLPPEGYRLHDDPANRKKATDLIDTALRARRSVAFSFGEAERVFNSLGVEPPIGYVLNSDLSLV